MSIKLGCIADDFTGATDLANSLVRAGMRVVQTIGVPSEHCASEVDAIVVALKSRTIAPAEAVAQSLDALRWLQAVGAEQIYFKYCSTFDSTPQGNIGPVADALMDALGIDFTVATPAAPDNARTVFNGYLFAGQVLLNESGMQNHPLTPMTDANLVRVMQAQTRRKVGLIDHATVARGTAAVRERIRELRAEGVGIALVDAISNEDLRQLASALRDLPLVTAASGLASGLAANFRLTSSSHASALPTAMGFQAIVSGSCSRATNAQVAAFIGAGGSAFELDPFDVARDARAVQKVLGWAAPRLAAGPLLVYSTADPAAVRLVQSELGSEDAGLLMERTLGAVAQGLVALGVRQLVVAGGETSGSCVQALGIGHLQIGAQIDPGVPWCHARAADAGGVELHVALKSGNFGAVDFFSKAFECLA
jgi:uncharacterized protein YgbK (DUF1537 family)